MQYLNDDNENILNYEIKNNDIEENTEIQFNNIEISNNKNWEGKKTRKTKSKKKEISIEL